MLRIGGLIPRHGGPPGNHAAVKVTIAGVDKSLAVIFMAVVGGLIALQAPINAGLGKETGSVGAVFISFATGTILIAAILVLSGKAGNLGGATHVEWYYLVGGLLGAVYVFTALSTVDSIGAGGVAAATVTGQLTASVVLDRLGVLGLEETPLSGERLLGVALLLAGTFLVVR
jgi:bacterial/archaeal transporter family-2 protein